MYRLGRCYVISVDLSFGGVLRGGAFDELAELIATVMWIGADGMCCSVERLHRMCTIGQGLC